MERKRPPALTDGEARVMSVLWRMGSGTVAEVLAEVRKNRATTYSTVQTMLRILETKGYVSHEKVARAFVYRPRIDERQARLRALRQLVSRLFNGSPSLLVLNVLDDERIDPEELKRVRQLIEEV
jgi:predicted transcriptional regulator